MDGRLSYDGDGRNLIPDPEILKCYSPANGSRAYGPLCIKEPSITKLTVSTPVEGKGKQVVEEVTLNNSPGFLGNSLMESSSSGIKLFVNRFVNTKPDSVAVKAMDLTENPSSISNDNVMEGDFVKMKEDYGVSNVLNKDDGEVVEEVEGYAGSTDRLNGGNSGVKKVALVCSGNLMAIKGSSIVLSRWPLDLAWFFLFLSFVFLIVVLFSSFSVFHFEGTVKHSSELSMEGTNMEVPILVDGANQNISRIDVTVTCSNNKNCPQMNEMFLANTSSILNEQENAKVIHVGHKRKPNLALGHIISYVLESKYNLQYPAPPNLQPAFYSNISFQTLHSTYLHPGDGEAQAGEKEAPTPSPTLTLAPVPAPILLCQHSQLD
ncbi:hypothetical protein MA16_Dca008398 [Dendrobium catenatum]|uniref:Uncharacterized protein n=1 Tax=Dendrobium catenatum TaxID=906689 RepID=A0A2I0VM38_9ASPA|nr:hypothetical protein MA16_Dca008398 [Dendrobium catenatum]